MKRWHRRSQLFFTKGRPVRAGSGLFANGPAVFMPGRVSVSGQFHFLRFVVGTIYKKFRPLLWSLSLNILKDTGHKNNPFSFLQTGSRFSARFLFALNPDFGKGLNGRRNFLTKQLSCGPKILMIPIL